MDDARFDHLTRALGTMLTRRRGVVAAAGGVVAALPMSRAGVAAEDPIMSCRPGLDRCGSGCCAPDARCRNGACEVQSGEPSACYSERDIVPLSGCNRDKKCCGNLKCVTKIAGNKVWESCDYESCTVS